MTMSIILHDDIPTLSSIMDNKFSHGANLL